jgi:exodeoxyribonuclease VII large subunit
MDLAEEPGLNFPAEDVLSLSDVLDRLMLIVNVSFPATLWVRTEIAKMNVYPATGHCYLDLVEKERGKVRAQARGIIWADSFEVVSEKFRQAVGEDLKGGLTVLFLARVNFHPVYGFSLVITDIEPEFTLGALAREKKLTIEKLKKEGIFDANRKVSLPLVPRRIAVISAETSKGYSDLLSIFRGYHRKYKLDIRLFPALLQGDRAVETIVAQLQYLETVKEQFDIVMIIRGGGDEIGMTCFDHYDLAREIALFPLPVVTGIGHSTNETVSEMVAAHNKITPTDVAYFILARLDSFLDELAALGRRAFELAGRRTREERQSLDHLFGMLAIHRAQFFRNSLSDLDHLQEMMILHRSQFFRNATSKLNTIESRIRDLDPRNVLKRGYSITRDEKGKIIRNPTEVESGAIISTELFSGTILSKVESTNQHDTEVKDPV